MGIPWSHGNAPVSFKISVGLSSKAADLDNVIKPLLDTFQSIYSEFNDNKVFHIEARKEIVEKGKEYMNVHVLQDELP